MIRFIMSERRRRKQQSPSNAGGHVKRMKPSMNLGASNDKDDHIDSSSDEEDSAGREPSLEEESADDEPLETKKVRLAREYLDKLDGASATSSSESDEEDDDDEQDPTARRLQKARMKKEGTFERAIADRVFRHVESLQHKLPLNATPKDWISGGHVHLFRGHDLTPTCVALSGENKAISGSKDHSVILWDVENQRRITKVTEHWKKSQPTSPGDQKKFRTQGQVLAVACSDDGRYAAVGRRNATVQIFDIRAKAQYNLVHTFDGHKGAVTCLAFQSGTNDLFSGSDDRCIRHYTLNEMMYLETLYGHQFGVAAIDCLARERPISVGVDRTARAWKLAEDTHLIFRGGAKIQAAESISLIKDEWFLTGHQDGHLSMWLTEKKKAVVTIEHSHGADANGIGRPVVSVAALRSSDLVVSGSCDGFLRFWNAQTGARLHERSLERAFEIPLDGYINAVAFGPKARFCVAAIGQEHRLGRWARIPGARNRLAIINLRNPDLVDAADANQDAGQIEMENAEVESAQSGDDSSAAGGSNSE
ncbi:hypothetical protein MPSEU_000949200 [Mayamaea pseudoterrestris]|nr:hypothetical protein MPSEU_000949200 [Mayamaea pseudoterrestris]